MAKFLHKILITLLVSTLIACGGQNTTEELGTKPKKENNRYPGKKAYYHSMDGTPTTLDPVRAAVLYSNFVVLNVFDTL